MTKLSCDVDNGESRPVVRIMNDDVIADQDPVFVRRPQDESAHAEKRWLNEKKCLVFEDIYANKDLIISIPSKSLTYRFTIGDSSIIDLGLIRDKEPPTLIFDKSRVFTAPGHPIPFSVSEEAWISVCFEQQTEPGSCSSLRSEQNLFAISQAMIMAPQKEGEYKLFVRLRDDAGNEGTLEKAVSVDGQAPFVYPDFRDVSQKIPYFGKDRFLVNSKTRLNFNVTHDGPKDVIIQYCLLKDEGIDAKTQCESDETTIFGEVNEERLTEGKWSVFYRAEDRAGNRRDDGWFRDDFFVEKVCKGQDFLDQSSDAEACTTVIDNLDVPSDIPSFSGYANLVKVAGSLILSGHESAKDLSGFENLREVGSLDIRFNQKLKSLDGLTSLTFVRDSIWIRDNKSLAQIDTLSHIQALSGTLDISNNDVLAQLDGLSGLRSVGNTLQLLGSPLIQHLDALRNLVSVGEFWLFYLQNLRSISGLRKLQSVSRLVLSQLPALESLVGLSQIKVLSVLYIMGCDKLENLDGLNSLTTITEEARIAVNTSLKSLDGLKSLEKFTGESFEINDNQELIDTKEICFKTFKGTLLVSENGKLADLALLSCLEVFDGSLTIDQIPIKSLADLSNLKKVTKGLVLRGLKKLEHIHTAPLPLTEVGGTLTITGLDLLQNLEGFQSLGQIGGDFVLLENRALENLKGLENLVSIRNKLQIENHPLLKSISELSRTLSFGSIQLKNNVLLKENPFQPTAPP
ncbi:MAG TPA: hypothetical protein VE954_06750 [Oligoflexus sp.]|uniref:hypothetical protein n=1 Tax=Oligoflexus sp. TaxID=1971216 RepID=UPI002D67CEC4|nr:hypothetical protein [Oligoflexus sp.]HYX32796.1 hypothetical protein [Oligoflexus sp.]